MREYFGGDATLAWLTSFNAPAAPLSALGVVPRLDAGEELVPWRGRQIRIEVRAGELKSYPGTDWPDAVMPCDYGAIVGTEALDGDPVDVLLIRSLDGVFADTCHAGIIVRAHDGSLDAVKLVVGARDEHAAGALLTLCYGGAQAGDVVEVDGAFMDLMLSGRADAESVRLRVQKGVNSSH